MSSSKKMVKVDKELEKLGHEVELPKHAEKYAMGKFKMESSGESTENKIKDDLIRDYYEKIKEGEGLLVVNENKNGIKGYIGGNAFLEMGFAHVLNKKIFLLNNVPEMIYTDEILAMQPVVINGDFESIVN